MKTRKTTRAEKIVRPGIYEVPVYDMDGKIKELAREAGFIFWKKESWGPGEDHIDWSCNYDKELAKFTYLVINAYKEYEKNEYRST